MRGRSVLWMALVLAPMACATQSVQTGSAAGAAVAPQLSVERFLQAANARDLRGMGRLFGTADGDYMETRRRQDVELQMAAISDILSHQDYRIVREEMVAGSDDPTQRVMVDMTIGGRNVRGVAFDVVQLKDNRWLVTRIDLEKAMSGG